MVDEEPDRAVHAHVLHDLLHHLLEHLVQLPLHFALLLLLHPLLAFQDLVQHRVPLQVRVLVLLVPDQQSNDLVQVLPEDGLEVGNPSLRLVVEVVADLVLDLDEPLLD